METWLKRFEKYLNDKGLRHSRPRNLVAQEFFRSDGHVGIESLYKRVHRINPKVGIATVYRTLNLLVESDLAVKRDFLTGVPTYERMPEVHHDHLLCTQCGDIIEFHQDQIEKLQDLVAKKYRFHLDFHKMELYGRCHKCFRNS